MTQFLFGWTVFLAGLILLGGAYFKTSIGKIEVGSVDLWAWGLGVFLLFTFYFLPRQYQKYIQKIESLLEKVVKFEKPQWGLIAVLSFFFFILFVAHIFSHWSFFTHFFDMGFVNQAVFYPFSDGLFLQADLSPKRSYLVDHFSPTLLFLAPLTSWLHSNILIFAIQAILVATGVYLMVRFGPLHRRKELWIFAAFIVISSRAVRAGAIWDFREDVMGFFFMALAVLFLYRGKLRIYFVALFLACLSKEHIGLVSLGILIPIIFDRSLKFDSLIRTKLIVGTVSFLVLWNVFLFAWIIPSLLSGIPQEVSNIVNRFPGYGETPREVVTTILTSPWAWWSLLNKMLDFQGLKYLVLLLGPYLFFAWRSWPWILAAALGIGINLAGPIAQKSSQFHYDLAFLPFLMMATVQGLNVAVKLTDRKLRFLFMGLFIAISFSGRWPMFYFFERMPTIEQARDAIYLTKVDCPTIIAANTRVLAHLNTCREIRSFVFSDRCHEDVMLDFEKMNQSDTTRIPGHNALNANEFVLDMRQACEKDFYSELILSGAKEVSHSPSGRFRYIKK